MFDLAIDVKKEKEDDQEITAETSTNSQTTEDKSAANSQYLKRNLTPDSEKNVSTLFVINLPMDWSQKDVKKFILDECKQVKKINMTTDNERDFTGIVVLQFETPQQCKRAVEALNGKQIEGHSGQVRAFCANEDDDFEVKSEKLDSEDHEASEAKKFKRGSAEQNEKLSAPDILDSDPSGLYGLKPEYLRSLDITPPLSRWVHVSNFRCDRSELKEVLELAGRVVMCKVVHNVKKKHARVMYSHPLESVQAISMLHNQKYYGLPLQITMESFTTGCLPLPNGLAQIGPGLGLFGQLLSDVPTNFHKYLKKRKSELNDKIFRTPEEIEEDLDKFMRDKGNEEKNNDFMITSNDDIPEWVKNKMEKQIGNTDLPKKDSLAVALRPITPNAEAKVVDSAMLRPFPSTTTTSSNSKYSVLTPNNSNFPPNSAIPSNMRPPANFPQVNPVNQPNFPFPSQNFQQNRPLMAQNPQLSVPGSWGSVGTQTGFAGSPAFNSGRPGCSFGPPAQVIRSTNPVKGEYTTVEIRNLPLSTTFPLLTEKMAEIGPVLSLQLTSPGCALVRFHQTTAADRCYQMYNNAIIMGNKVTVSYV